MEFRDDATAFDGAKKAQLKGKGSINNQFNAWIMQQLEKAGIIVHYISTLNQNTSIVKKLDMFPIECVVRNISAGSLCKRLGIEEGKRLSPPLFETFLKDDELGDPLITAEHIELFGWATKSQLAQMKERTLAVNEVLSNIFQSADLLLVDYKLEFGMSGDQLVLGDEFTPDSCRVWDAETGKKLDKDRFRFDMGNVTESYQEIALRIGAIDSISN